MGRRTAKRGGSYRRFRHGHRARQRERAARSDAATFVAWLASPVPRPNDAGGTETVTSGHEAADRAAAVESAERGPSGPGGPSGDHGPLPAARPRPVGGAPSEGR